MPSRFSDDQHVIDSAEDAATGRAGAEDRRLAGAFRPHLKFDRKEKYRPLDVDAYLSETGGADDYLELPDNATPDVGRDPPPRERIYYRRTDEVDPETKQVSRVQLDYWWFFRFNASPVAAEFMCLRGLAIKETTCFDHDGDWEGITVTLKRADAGSSTRWEGESVTYAGHKWRYRYAWPVLDDVGVIEDETHPTVYVARGSHASYPASCHTQDTTKPRSCRQLGSVVPDGKRNGATAWDHNTRCRSCLLELPTDQYGTAARWNAFGGRWGAAACTYGLKLCVRGDGPRSPAYQSRYKEPAVSDPGPVCDLYKRSGMRCPPLPSGKPVAHTGRAHPAAPGLYFNGYLLPLSGQLPAMRRTSRRIARARKASRARPFAVRLFLGSASS